MDGIKISVIISTFNRHELLKRALESLYCQTFSPDTFEIIVVDNNSTDETTRLSDSSVNPASHVIRYIKEEKQGISPARNRGVLEAKGNIVAFIDDDATAEPEWLESLFEVYQSFPEASIVGGRIIPEWSGRKPAWLTKNLEKNYGALDLENETSRIYFPLTLFGGNFSIIRQLFLELGGFHDHLGRSSKGLLSSEEVYLCYQAEQSNKSIFYTPNAIIHHHTPKERLTKYFLLKRTFYQGISNIVMKEICNDIDNLSLSSFLTELINKTKNLIRNFLTGNKDVTTEDLAEICRTLGSILKLLLIKINKLFTVDKCF